MTFLGSWETIPRASVPSITTMTAFKTRLNGEISNIQRIRPLQVMTASGAPNKRHSYKSPYCIKQDAEEGLKQLSEPSISIINEPRDEAIPADISCRKYSLRTQNDHCAQGQFFLTNKRILEIPAVSYMNDDKSHLFKMLKIASLTGIFSLQDYHPALASTDIMTVVQSGSWLGDLGDISTGFTSAFLLIFFSELGDKTFFIAALLASRKSSAPVFLGTFGALAVMTIISVFLGRTFHYADDILQFRVGDMELPLDDLAAVGLLVYFGVSTLLEAGSNDKSKKNDEQEEAELAIAGLSGGGAGIVAAANTVISTFALVFVAEWGDKSFFSTIALAAASSPLGVVGGAVAGHGVATLIAVLGGSLLGTYISEKVITYTGGVLFLVFAAVTLFEIFM